MIYLRILPQTQNVYFEQLDATDSYFQQIFNNSNDIKFIFYDFTIEGNKDKIIKTTNEDTKSNEVIQKTN